MTAHCARFLRTSLAFILAALVSLPAMAETLIIVPADESGSTAMAKDIAKTVIIPIMKAGKHKVIPYKNYRQAALSGGIEATQLAGQEAMVAHGAKLGATKGVEVKVLRQDSKVSLRIVDIATKATTFEKALVISGSSLSAPEGKDLISAIYTGVSAKPAPTQVETPAAAPAEPTKVEAPAAAPAEPATAEAPAAAPAEPATAEAPAAAPAEPAKAEVPAAAPAEPAKAEAPAAAPAEPAKAEAPAAAPELELELDAEVQSKEVAESPAAIPETTASATVTLPQMVTLRAGNKALYFSSVISDGTTQDLNYATNAFVPGIAVGATIAPVSGSDVPTWAQHLTLGFTLNPILVQPQAYSTTGDFELVMNWSMELGYAPRALSTTPELAIGAFANFSSFSMPVGLGGFPDVGLQMLETGVVATYDAGDVLTVQDILRGLTFELSASLGIGLGVDDSLNVLGDAGLTLGYGASINAQTRVFDFFQVGTELGFSGTSTSFSGTSALSERREQFNDASLSSSHVTFQLFARKSFL